MSDEEFEKVKKHTEYGAEFLKNEEKDLNFNSFLKLAVQIAGAHHENWDGSGYPKNLKKDQIPLSARITALADVYDTLRNKRPYKDYYSHEKTVEIIKADSGKKFDPDIVEVFLRIEKEFKRIAESC